MPLNRLYRSGFQSTLRANTLAQKIVASDIALGLNASFSFYTPDNCEFERRDDESEAYKCRIRSHRR